MRGGVCSGRFNERRAAPSIVGKTQAGQWGAPYDEPRGDSCGHLHALVSKYDKVCSQDVVLLLWLFQAFSPVRQLRADQLLSLGSLVTEMSERELHDIGFTNPAVLAHLGTLTDWSLRKVRF